MHEKKSSFSQQTPVFEWQGPVAIRTLSATKFLNRGKLQKYHGPQVRDPHLGHFYLQEARHASGECLSAFPSLTALGAPCKALAAGPLRQDSPLHVPQGWQMPEQAKPWPSYLSLSLRGIPLACQSVTGLSLSRLL